jgi:predicted SnoaL-like aldol condensation-catalyzing enzyme
MSEPNLTAREVAELYTLSAWNEPNLDLADALVADTVIRHDVGQAHAMTRAESRKQIEDTWARADKLRFDLRLVIADDDGEHVAVIYDGTLNKDGEEMQVASIEVYRIIDGQITEIWNCGARPGHWL